MVNPVQYILSRIWDQKLSTKWPNVIGQTGLATLCLVVFLVLEDALLNAAILVAVASTAFTVFVVPDSIAAMPRRVIGGHIVSVIIGVSIWYVLAFVIPVYGDVDRRYILDAGAAISVGLSLLLMVLTNTEHPPAAGTALGLVIHGSSWSAVAFILVSAIVLTLIRLALRPRLTNLL
jgi:CBS-domain-containing membrane protein